jgi:hypothetical protein
VKATYDANGNLITEWRGKMELGLITNKYKRDFQKILI